MAATRPMRMARALSPPIHPAVLLGVYGTAIFVSAALLFAVQPLFTKMVLPQLGGSPSVWSVAMVFFQATLLAGYLYAHLLTCYVPGRPSVVVHVLVLIAATLALPLAIATGWGRPPAEGEAFWLIGLFLFSIGLPFFALSANAPLLQAWFARTGHPSAKDPYFLYAASNIGSFLALLSYPFAVEPLTRLGDQTKFWSLLFYGLIALIAVCGVLLVQSRNSLPGAARAGAGKAGAPTARDAAIWVTLAAVPSAFLIAVTAHISTDVAASPLLWVIPLALYLLSFVIVFQTRRMLPHWFFVNTQPVFIALLLAVLIYDELNYIFIILALNIAAFFVTAMVCHGELAMRRPAARHLTEFYLWMSVGGVIGGISAGLIAPHAFNWVAEYPLLIVAGLLCRPGFAWPKDLRWWLFWLAAIAATALIAYLFLRTEYWPQPSSFYGMLGCVLVFAVLFLAHDTLKFAGVVAAVLTLIYAYHSEGSKNESIRSFFGVNKVYETTDGEFRVFMHGTTIHGAQRILDENDKPVTGRPEPVTYFGPKSPMARAFAAAHQNKRGALRIAVVGLGIGTLACHTGPRDTLHLYEIDQAVVRIATDPARFTFVSHCKPDAKIILGDARLTIADSPDAYYDLIVMDAFTSDAVPIHLLTREAMALYLKKLAPGGMAISHVMNRHMELASVFAGIAAANGLVTRVMDSEEIGEDEKYIFGSTVAAAARADRDFGALRNNGNWRIEKPDPEQWIWTDDYSNIVGAMIRRLRQ